MSAFGGKADMTGHRRMSTNDPKRTYGEASLADPLWGADAILYKERVDPPGAGSST